MPEYHQAYLDWLREHDVEFSVAENLRRDPDHDGPLVEEDDAAFRPIELPDRGHPGTRRELLRRLRMEVSLAARNSFALHVVSFHTGVHDAGVGETLARHLSEVGARLLRASDGVYRAAPRCTAIVMPSTGGEEAATLAHRMVQALRDRDPHAAYGALETRVVALDSTNTDVASILEALGIPLIPEGTS